MDPLPIHGAQTNTEAFTRGSGPQTSPHVPASARALVSTVRLEKLLILLLADASLAA